MHHTSTTRALLCLLTTVLCFTSPAHAAKSGSARTAANNATATSQSLQSTKNLTQKNQNPNAADATPDENTAENWCLELTPSYIAAAKAPLDTYYGATLALGYRLTQGDKLQLEIGYYRSNTYTDNNYTYNTTLNATTVPLSGTRTAKATMIPLLLAYSSCIQLGSAGRFELRLTPAAGLIHMRDTYAIAASTPGYAETYNGKNNKTALALGAGLGLTWNFAPRLYLDAGYRFLWINTVSNNPATNGAPWNGIAAWNGMNTHTYTLTLGWKF